ncbi:MAG: AvrE-family type 3 secretion system effector [Exilibacterium sp.]
MKISRTQPGSVSYIQASNIQASSSREGRQNQAPSVEESIYGSARSYLSEEEFLNEQSNQGRGSALTSDTIHADDRRYIDELDPAQWQALRQARDRSRLNFPAREIVYGSALSPLPEEEILNGQSGPRRDSALTSDTIHADDRRYIDELAPAQRQALGQARDRSRLNFPARESLYGSALSPLAEEEILNGQSGPRRDSGPSTSDEVHAREPAQSPAQELYKTIENATKNIKTGSIEAQVLNRTGMESQPKSGMRDLLHAHCFNPRANAPRPLKNLGYAIQHNWKGREGLRPLYEMESALFSQLESARIKSAGSIRPQSLKSRLQNVSLGQQGEHLLQAFSDFLDDIERSAEHQLILLGLHQGVINANGQLNQHYSSPRMKRLAQPFNPNRTGHDLSRKLLKVWRDLPVSESRTELLLQEFVRMGVNMSYQKTDVPFNRQRDPNDMTALTKARLVLDALTLQELEQLAEVVELIAGGTPTHEQIRTLSERLIELREKRYGDNPVKQYTDMGFTDHQTLEADYDAIKAFMNAFKKEDHAVNVTTRTVTNTTSQSELNHKLKAIILTLGKDENLSFNRKYGAGTNLKYENTLVPIFTVYPAAKASMDRIYNLSFSRAGTDIKVSFERELGTGVNASMEVGYEAFPRFFNNLEEKINGGGKMIPVARVFKADINPGLQHIKQNGLSFTLSEAELGHFVDGLIQGTLNPVDVLKKGMGHEVKKGSKWSFNLDLTVSSEFRLNLNSTDSNPNSGAVFRISAGINSHLNLVSVPRERSTTRGKNALKKMASDNRPTFMNKASAGVYLATNLMGARPAGGGSIINENKAHQLSASVTFENRTSKKSELRLNEAKPPNGNEINALIEQFREHFIDHTSQEILRDIELSSNPAEKISIINQHFASKIPETDDQYFLLNELHNVTIRHRATEKNAYLLSEANYSVSYTRLSRLNHDSLVDTILSRLSPQSRLTISQKIERLMREDRELKSLIETLQKQINSKASVTLELKDQVKIRAQKALLEGTMAQQDIAHLLRRPENLRLKSISVTQKVKKQEGIKIPLLLSYSSSVTISMEKLLGKVVFKYGRNEDKPTSYTITGIPSS